MDIRLDLNDPTPFYAQIVKQIRFLIASGSLKPGEALDSVRVLSERTEMTPNTIVRAYQELERQRLVVKRSTTGTYVTDEAAEVLSARVANEVVDELLDAAIAKAQELNVKHLIDRLRSRLQASTRKQPKE